MKEHFAEQLEHLTRFGMTPRALLRIETFAIDNHVEDSLRACDQGQFSDDVLIVVQQIVGSAHGAL